MSRKRPGDINKTYLSNTIIGVESHNRREQETDCWRQLKLLKKIEEGTLGDSADEDDRKPAPPQLRWVSDSIADADIDERAIWAARKVIPTTIDVIESIE